MPLDLLALLNAFVNFLLFLIIHIFIFRSEKYKTAPQVIFMSFLLGFPGLLIVHTLGFIFIPLMPLRLGAFLFTGIVAMGLYLILVFHYIAWIFGMSEAAMRIRLLNEIELHPQKRATLEDIYQNYNGEKILEVRLKRLLNAGHLTYDGQYYYLKGKVLLLQDFVSGLFKKLLGFPQG